MRRALLVALLTLNFVALADPKGATGTEAKTQSRGARPADTPSSGSGYTVTTVFGGNPSPAPPNLAAVATSVPIPSPFSVAVDAAGNVYFSAVDSQSGTSVTPNSVFRFDTNGALTRVVGNGSQGYAGDGGLAINAELESNYGVYLAADATGNLYISDVDGNRVREVSASTGVITTVAGNGTCANPASGVCDSGDGGLAINAQVTAGAIAVDSAGNLYVVGYTRVRKVSASTGVITTVAGNGTPGYSGDGGPATGAEVATSGIAVDIAGNLYLADEGGRIRKVSASTGIISTVATGAMYAAALAVDAAGNLYVSYVDDNVILKVTASTGITTRFAGGGNPPDGVGDGGPATSASLRETLGIAVDASGNVYIADSFSDRIRKVDASGIITTAAGGGPYPPNGPATARYLGLGPIAVDSAGDLYSVIDNSIVREAAGATGTLSILGDATGWSGGMTVDSAGNLYVAVFPNLFLKVAANGIVTTTAVNFQAGAVVGLATDSAGNLYTANQPFCDFLWGSLSNPGYTEYCRSGHVLRIDTTGNVTNIAGNPESFCEWGCGDSGDGRSAVDAAINPLGSIAVDAVGDIYILDRDSVRMVSGSSGIINTVAGNGHVGYSGDGGPANAASINASSAWLDSAGNLYIAGGTVVGGPGVVRKVDASTGIITTVAGNGTPGNSGDGGPALSAEIDPDRAAVDGAGNIYFTTGVSADYNIFGSQVLYGIAGIRRLAPPGVANLSIAATHAGNFVLGQNGTYTLAVSNATGAGATAGPVTVTDFVPQWVKLVSMSGDGWNCTANACTRSDALAGGASYPPITVTVSVPSGAPSQITNQVTVSTAGAVPSGVSDFTLITPPPTVAAAVNGASFSGGAAPGSIASIFGTWLGDAVTGASAVPLPASLSGVSLSINGTPAPLWFVSPTQINFEMPVEVTPGTATAVVTFGDTSTAPFSVTVPQAAPGIFTYGANRAVAVNNPGQTLTDSSNPAPVGSVITVYLTGIGPVDQPVADNTLSPASPPARATLPASATIGGQGAAIQFIGLTPGSIALAQANIVVPNLAPGDYPVVITVGGAASNAATITVGSASKGH
jgi:uncharacterized protein (TIGR03437 family)